MDGQHGQAVHGQSDGGVQGRGGRKATEVRRGVHGHVGLRMAEVNHSHMLACQLALLEQLTARNHLKLRWAQRWKLRAYMYFPRNFHR